jgi:hypothetical protein
MGWRVHRRYCRFYLDSVQKKDEKVVVLGNRWVGCAFAPAVHVAGITDRDS